MKNGKPFPFTQLIQLLSKLVFCCHNICYTILVSLEATEQNANQINRMTPTLQLKDVSHNSLIRIKTITKRKNFDTNNDIQNIFFTANTLSESLLEEGKPH